MSALAAVLAAAVAATPSSPELFYEQTATTSVDGKIRETTRSKVYWSGRRIRLESGDAFDPLILLLDLGRERAYRLDPAARKAYVLDVDALRARSHLGFAMAGERLGAAGPTEFRRRPLTGRRTIAGYACEGQRLRAGSARIDVWVAPDAPLDMTAFTEFLEWTGAAASLGGFLPELEKLDGFPLETRSHVEADGHVYETTATVTRLEPGRQDAALFEVPPQYALEAEEPEP